MKVSSRNQKPSLFRKSAARSICFLWWMAMIWSRAGPLSCGEALADEDYVLHLGGAIQFNSNRILGAQADARYRFEDPTTTGWFEGGFAPEVSFGLTGLGSSELLFVGRAGGTSATNLGTDEFGKTQAKMALLAGYPDILRASPDFVEGNFLGLAPFYVSGIRYRLPKGHVDGHWIPYQLLFDRRNGYSYSASGLMGVAEYRFTKLDEVNGALKLAIPYSGGNDLGARQRGVGVFLYLNGTYLRTISPKNQIGGTLSVEYLGSAVAPTAAAAPAAASVFSLGISVYYKREF